MTEAELSWKLKDYLEKGQEPPERLIALPLACEGELMSDEEIEQYILDGVSTLKVLKDHGSARFEQVQSYFFADLKFLVSIDRLASEDYTELIKPENYHF